MHSHTGGYPSGLTSEYFDEETNSFLEGPALPEELMWHCAARLDEAIYITGGVMSESTFIKYDWDSQTWTQMPDLPNGHSEHGCEIIDTSNGKELWLVGGIHLDSVDIFNFDSMTWSTGIPLPAIRWGLSTVVVENNIIVIGGKDENYSHSTIWEWNPDSNSWNERYIGLDGPRSFFGATLVDERSGVVCN